MPDERDQARIVIARLDRAISNRSGDAPVKPVRVRLIPHW
jgi:hypothetical protein